MKRILILFLAMALVLGTLGGCASDSGERVENGNENTNENAVETAESEEVVEEKVIFTDSTGRQVEVPSEITKIAVSGPLAQIVLFSLAPDKQRSFLIQIIIICQF